ncbi:MAG: prepilin-type N-terminal cleavage/methylation domain-containing protein [Desulfobacterales bacterium]
MEHESENRQQGFSLIEIMISMAIGMVILTALSTTFLIQRDVYAIQDQINEAVQTVRATMEMMTREIKMAGYDPTDNDFSGVIYSADQLQILSDHTDGVGGVTGDPNENITYKYYDTATYPKQLKRKTGNGYFQPFAENIEAFTFQYLDSTGTATTTTASIRQVRITITARTEKADSDYPENGGYRTVTMTSLVVPPNLSFP